MSFRQEIHRLVYTHTDDYGKCEECEYRTDQIIKLFEKRIEDKIHNIKKDRENSDHDFEGDSNLESQIEMLLEWKDEILMK